MMMITKQEDAPTGKTVKEVAWFGIEELARAEQEKAPTRSRQACIAAALLTAEGRELYLLYKDPANAKLTVPEFTGKQAAEAERLATWGTRTHGGIVATIAKRRAELCGTDYGSELDNIAKRYPQLWAQYQAERGV